MSGEQLTATAVTRAMVQATIDYVHERRYTSADGAIGIRGRMTQPIGAFTHDGTTVRTVHCTSSLAARDALLKRVPEEWLVIVTDRSDDELGTGVLTHLVGHQLRRPDPWQTVRQRFAAQAVDPQLVARAGHRDLAFGLLEVLPGGAWPPAPSGLLTRDHAFSTLARQVLGLPDGPIDLVTVLGWAARQDATRRLREIRDTGGNSLADALIEWLASTAGTAAPAVFGLLSSGRPGDLLPLGLVINLLDDHPGQARELALARLGHHWSGIPDAAMHHLADQAPSISGSMLLDRSRHSDAERAIARADALLEEAQATQLAGSSDQLRSGLDVRLRQLGHALSGSGTEAATAVEQAWLHVNAHVLSSPNNPLLSAFHGAVRLHRWLTSAAPDSSDGDFAALARRQLDTDGWVDAAVNDASAGAADDQLAAALNSILTRTREVRDAHDRAFAHALSNRAAEPFGTLTDGNGRTVVGLEDVLPTLILPVAQHAPVLLLVLDGLSTGVSVELFDDLFGGDRPHWAELWFPERSHRVAGVSVLPSVTEMSRTSLLSGTLIRGTQDTERKNHAALATAHGLTSDIFHKKALDSVAEGSSLATEVRAAIDDPQRQLVTCVLNTIDDSLDRSDPAGTHWSVSAVKHLQALLDRARAAGRIVIITSDHGHVVERRLGWSRNDAGTGPARHRASDNTVTEDEITVTGERVLTPDHTAVLAVSERLRYRKLSAGYHGGASPAEVVVPIVALAPTEMDPPPGLSLAVPAEPAWWSGVVQVPRETVEPPVATEWTQQPSLLDEPAEPAPAFGPALVASTAYAVQKQLAGRVVVPDERIAALLTAIVESPQSRLTSVQAAQLLGLPPSKMTGAFEQLRKILNVDGYPVIQRDTATGAVILDQGLAREQFEVPS